MTIGFNLRRIAAAGLAVVLSAALAACFVLPGKFAETLDLRKDGRFSYTYKGEIVVLGLTKLMGMANAASTIGIEESPEQLCYSKKTGRERPCTKAELAKQKADWEAGKEARAASAKERDQQMAAVMGGLDPNDPKSGEELAVRLRKQAGWKSVTYKGDGVYEVDFQVSGQLAYDFSFPTIEKLPAVLPFLAINVRGDRSVRISSPLMDQTNGAGANAMGLGALGAMVTADKAVKDSGEQGPAGKDDYPAPFPTMDGTFTLTTDAEVLANNTEDGPQADGTGKRLEWKLNVRNATPPTALLQLAQ
jgi:hypothetical protein